jgi:hypothetical protein
LFTVGFDVVELRLKYNRLFSKAYILIPLLMPKLDIIHNAVKNALIKDGWIITDDPYIIEYRKTKLYADLGAFNC